jgi:hypothetical protein
MDKQATGRFCSVNHTQAISKMTILARTTMQIIVVLAMGGALAAATPQQKTPACRGETLTDKIIELRNYTLLSGQRDTLIELFEREFLETQEAVGARIVGTFRDIDGPDHFVWIRSFKDLNARARALTTFYNGPAWHAHGKAANAMMIDTDNVQMLHSTGPLLCLPAGRPTPDATDVLQTLLAIDIYALSVHTEKELRAQAIRDPAIIGMFATEHSPNNFPALPVHSNSVFVTVRRFDAKQRVIPRSQGLPEPEQTLRLRPTLRSLLR